MAVDPLGRYEEYTYDDLGRMKTRRSDVTLAGGMGTTGCNNASGVVCAMWTWDYDEVGNVIRETIPTGSCEPLDRLGLLPITASY